jgi:hypothetical protein
VVERDILVRGKTTFLVYTKGVRDITPSRSIVGPKIVEAAIAEEVLDRVRLFRREWDHSPRSMLPLRQWDRRSRGTQRIRYS